MDSINYNDNYLEEDDLMCFETLDVPGIDHFDFTEENNLSSNIKNERLYETTNKIGYNYQESGGYMINDMPVLDSHEFNNLS